MRPECTEIGGHREHRELRNTVLDKFTNDLSDQCPALLLRE